MNVRDALRKRSWFNDMDTEDREAAKSDIERALRAAYDEGWQGCNNGSPHVLDRGVTAGVAAMVKKPND